MIGCVMFFENFFFDRLLDDYGYERFFVGYMYGSLGMIIWVIMIFFSILEFFFVIGVVWKVFKLMYVVVRYIVLV